MNSSVYDEQWVFTDGNNEKLWTLLPVCSYYPIHNDSADDDNDNRSSVTLSHVDFTYPHWVVFRTYGFGCTWSGCDAFSLYKNKQQQMKYPLHRVVSPSWDIFIFHISNARSVQVQWSSKASAQLVDSFEFCRLFKGSNLQIDTHWRVIVQWSDFPIVSDCVCMLFFSLFSVRILSPQKTNSGKHVVCLRETFDNHRTMIAV